MEPSSRTPEGEANRCPVCAHEVRVVPSIPPGDAPCPHCGHLLWFVPSDTEQVAASSEQDVDRRFRRGVCGLNISGQIVSARPGDYLEVIVAEADAELDQGIGYLSGRTVVVIERAAKHLHKNVHIVVTSVLKSSRGSMVFGRVAAHGWLVRVLRAIQGHWLFQRLLVGQHPRV
jgi:hypothetical protein